MELAITPASKLDLPHLFRLVNVAFQEREGWLIPGPRLGLAEVPRELLSDGVRTLVARRNGRPVGCVRLRTRRLPGAPSVPELGLLAVEPALQRTGIGAALVRAAEILAFRSGFDTVHLQCGRELGTEGWYQSLGYEAVAWEYGTRWGATRAFTLVRMRRRIRPRGELGRFHSPRLSPHS